MNRSEFFKKSILGAIAIWKAPEILAKLGIIGHIQTLPGRISGWKINSEVLNTKPVHRTFNTGDILFHEGFDEIFVFIRQIRSTQYVLLWRLRTNENVDVRRDILINDFVKIETRPDIV